MKPVYFAVLAACCAILAPLKAQQPANNPPIPQIVVTGRGETKITPDRATIQISVQSRDATAAAAAADNAKKQTAVIASIKALGIKDEQISTSNYSIVPEQKYTPNNPPVVTGYTVTNTVVVDVRNITMVGAVIDAAVSHGSNLISGLSFYASNTDAARRTAIASAVEAARSDADAAAKAAHGSLGELIEMDVGGGFAPPPRPIMMARMGVGGVAQDATPISPGEETLTVEITARWRFIQGG
jgi:uncharacterized protein